MDAGGDRRPATTLNKNIEKHEYGTLSVSRLPDGIMSKAAELSDSGNAFFQPPQVAALTKLTPLSYGLTSTSLCVKKQLPPPMTMVAVFDDEEGNHVEEEMATVEIHTGLW